MTQQQPTYETDFYGWAMMEANLLRQHQLNDLDIKNIIQELESMGASERRELITRLSQILMHLLKWQFQATLRSNSWKISIRKQRRGVQRIIKENPSLKAKLDSCLLEAYEDARDDAIDETGLDENTFPKECPYTFDQLMDNDFLLEYDFKE